MYSLTAAVCARLIYIAEFRVVAGLTWMTDVDMSGFRVEISTTLWSSTECRLKLDRIQLQSTEARLNVDWSSSSRHSVDWSWIQSSFSRHSVDWSRHSVVIQRVLGISTLNPEMSTSVVHANTATTLKSPIPPIYGCTLENKHIQPGIFPLKLWVICPILAGDLFLSS